MSAARLTHQHQFRLQMHQPISLEAQSFYVPSDAKALSVAAKAVNIEHKLSSSDRSVSQPSVAESFSRSEVLVGSNPAAANGFCESRRQPRKRLRLDLGSFSGPDSLRGSGHSGRWDCATTGGGQHRRKVAAVKRSCKPAATPQVFLPQHSLNWTTQISDAVTSCTVQQKSTDSTQHTRFCGSGRATPLLAPLTSQRRP